MLFGHRRVQPLGDGVDDLLVLDGQQDGVPQILVALDVGGDADLMNDLGDLHLQIGGGPGTGYRAHLTGPFPTQGQDPLGHSARVKGLEKIIVRCGGHHLTLQGGIVKTGHNHHPGTGNDLPLLNPLQHPQGVQPGQEYVHQ